VFLSYRRGGGWQSALLVEKYLQAHDFDVFIDTLSLGSGAFPSVIEHQIEARPHFVVVLTPGALARARDESDWLRREITHAIECKRNIVPLFFDGFSFDHEDMRSLRRDVAAIGTLSEQNGVTVHNDYFDAAMAKLCTQFLRRPGGVITPTPVEERAQVARILDQAKRADEAMGVRVSLEGAAQSPHDAAVFASEATTDGRLLLPVFYATDRHRRPLGWNPDLRFTGARSEHVWLGRARVSFPPTHRLSAIERPSMLRLLFKEDASKHVVIDELSELSLDEYATSVAAHVAKSRRSEALIYLHGYNIRFGDAVRRTAQIAYDLKFEGAAIAFSWPSLGTTTGYTRDEVSVAWSAAHVEAFLRQLGTRMGVERIHVLSHNIGARAVIDALQRAEPAADGSAIPRIRQLVFAAPDIDAALFRHAAPRLTAAAERVTLYASAHDTALSAARLLHGYPRAGESEPQPVVVPGVDTIVSSVRSTSLGHSYYRESGTIIPDLYYLLRTGAPPDERAGLVRQEKEGMAYWVLGL